MNVAFYYHSAPNKESEELYDWMMDRAVEAVRKHMPRAKVWHLRGPSVPAREVDDDIVLEDRLRMQHHAFMGDTETLFLDIDAIVQEDVSDVFDKPFDAAVCVRPKATLHSWKRIPYNGGVTFTRSAEFWRGAERMYAPEGWPLSEVPLNRYIVTECGGFKLLRLPGERYNYSPGSLNEELKDCAIVHWKGAERKRWMRERYG